MYIGKMENPKLLL